MKIIHHIFLQHQFHHDETSCMFRGVWIDSGVGIIGAYNKTGLIANVEMYICFTFCLLTISHCVCEDRIDAFIHPPVWSLISFYNWYILSTKVCFYITIV